MAMAMQGGPPAWHDTATSCGKLTKTALRMRRSERTPHQPMPRSSEAKRSSWNTYGRVTDRRDKGGERTAG